MWIKLFCKIKEQASLIRPTALDWRLEAAPSIVRFSFRTLDTRLHWNGGKAIRRNQATVGSLRLVRIASDAFSRAANRSVTRCGSC